MACPLTLPRTVGRRFVSPRWEWPRWLESKWLAIGLLVLFFWAYEALDLWLSPWWTAWIVVGYFVVAFTVDMLFRGAAFCKYVCPVGQFQFVQSLVSPWQVRVRDPGICTSCRTKECMRGGSHARGCEMQLMVPRKSDNLDCTFCLDCVHACPAANVGVLAVVPLCSPRVLESSSAKSRQRNHSAARTWRHYLAAVGFCRVRKFRRHDRADDERRAMVGSCTLKAFPPLPPKTCICCCRWWSRSASHAAARRSAWSRTCVLSAGISTGRIVCRFAPTLVPLGAAMWLAHYGFHLVEGSTSA